MTATISIPAYAPHETITLTAPTEWHKRIAALSPRCLYGPRFSRPLVDTLVSLHYAVRDGYLEIAALYLTKAEELASR